MLEPIRDRAEHQPDDHGKRNGCQKHLARLKRVEQHHKADAHHRQLRRIAQDALELALAHVL